MSLRRRQPEPAVDTPITFRDGLSFGAGLVPQESAVASDTTNNISEVMTRLDTLEKNLAKHEQSKTEAALNKPPFAHPRGNDHNESLTRLGSPMNPVTNAKDRAMAKIRQLESRDVSAHTNLEPPRHMAQQVHQHLDHIEATLDKIEHNHETRKLQEKVMGKINGLEQALVVQAPTDNLNSRRVMDKIERLEQTILAAPVDSSRRVMDKIERLEQTLLAAPVDSKRVMDKIEDLERKLNSPMDNNNVIDKIEELGRNIHTPILDKITKLEQKVAELNPSDKLLALEKSVTKIQSKVDPTLVDQWVQARVRHSKVTRMLEKQ